MPPSPRASIVAVLFIVLLHSIPSGRTLATEEGKTTEEKEHRGFRIETIERERGEKISRLRIRVSMDTGVEATWEILRNLEQWDRFLSLFSRVTPLGDRTPPTHYRLSVSPPWPIPDFESVIWVKKLPRQRTILWRVQKGRMRDSYGRISVKEREGGCLIDYESLGPAGHTAPKWMVKLGLYFVVPSLARDFHDRVLEEEAERARPSGQGPSTETDRIRTSSRGTSR